MEEKERTKIGRGNNSCPLLPPENWSWKYQLTTFAPIAFTVKTKTTITVISQTPPTINTFTANIKTPIIDRSLTPPIIRINPLSISRLIPEYQYSDNTIFYSGSRMAL